MLNEKTMDTVQRLTDLRLLFEELKEILKAENGENWLPGVDAVLERLDFTSKAPPKVDVIQEVISIFRTMNSGQGGFSDFFLWRDDFEERVAANAHFKGLKSKIWAILERFKTE